MLTAVQWAKYFLAFLPKKERDAILTQKGIPRRTKNTIMDSKDLMEHLKVIKSQGCAVDSEDGIRCVTPPIRNYRGEVITGISISGPAVWINKERINRKFKSQVMEAPARIT